MATVQSPISPHLQVYKYQLTSVLSITHRMTGVVLSAASIVFCAWLASIAAGPQAYAAVMSHVTAWYGWVLIVAFSFSLYYHLCNGIRHLFWDIGKGLEIESAYRSGYAVIFFSIALTAATFLLGCM